MDLPTLLPGLSRNDKINALTAGHGRLALDRVAEGWLPYLLVLKFRHLGGNRQTVMAQMHRAAERAYAGILTRVWRHPRAARVRDLRPVWTLIADVPVPKRQKGALRDLIPNDGLHLQGVAVLPPASRLREGLDRHLEEAVDRYCPPGSPLVALHATPITSDIEYVHRYNFKAVPRGQADFDNVLILPNSSTELDWGSPRRATEPWRPLIRVT